MFWFSKTNLASKIQNYYSDKYVHNNAKLKRHEILRDYICTCVCICVGVYVQVHMTSLRSVRFLVNFLMNVFMIEKNIRFI